MASSPVIPVVDIARLTGYPGLQSLYNAFNPSGGMTDDTDGSPVDRIAGSLHTQTPELPASMTNTAEVKTRYNKYRSDMIKKVFVLVRCLDTIHDFGKPRSGINQELATQTRNVLRNILSRVLRRLELRTITSAAAISPYVGITQKFIRLTENISFEPTAFDDIMKDEWIGDEVSYGSSDDTLRESISKKMVINVSPSSREEADGIENKIKIFLGMDNGAPLKYIFDAAPGTAIEEISRLKSPGGAITVITETGIADSADSFGSKDKHVGEREFRASFLDGKPRVAPILSLRDSELVYKTRPDFGVNNPTGFDILIQNRTPITTGSLPRNVKISHSGYKLGPPVVHIMNAIGSANASGNLKEHAIPLLRLIQDNQLSLENHLVQGLADNPGARVLTPLSFALGLDVKREGDYGQAIAAAEMYYTNGENTIFSTGDKLASLFAILIGVPTIWHSENGNIVKVHVYKGSERGELTPAQEYGHAKAEYDSLIEKITKSVAPVLGPTLLRPAILAAPESIRSKLAEYADKSVTDITGVVSILDSLKDHIVSMANEYRENKKGLKQLPYTILMTSLRNLYDSIPILKNRYENLGADLSSSNIAEQLKIDTPNIYYTQFPSENLEQVKSSVDILRNIYTNIVETARRLGKELNQIAKLTEDIRDIGSRPGGITLNYIIDLVRITSPNAYFGLKNIIDLHKGIDIVIRKYAELKPQYDTPVMKRGFRGNEEAAKEAFRETIRSRFSGFVNKFISEPLSFSIKGFSSEQKESIRVFLNGVDNLTIENASVGLPTLTAMFDSGEIDTLIPVSSASASSASSTALPDMGNLTNPYKICVKTLQTVFKVSHNISTSVSSKLKSISNLKSQIGSSRNHHMNRFTRRRSKKHSSDKIKLQHQTGRGPTRTTSRKTFKVPSVSKKITQRKPRIYTPLSTIGFRNLKQVKIREELAAKKSDFLMLKEVAMSTIGNTIQESERMESELLEESIRACDIGLEILEQDMEDILLNIPISYSSFMGGIYGYLLHLKSLLFSVSIDDKDTPINIKFLMSTFVAMNDIFTKNTESLIISPHLVRHIWSSRHVFDAFYDMRTIVNSFQKIEKEAYNAAMTPIASQLYMKSEFGASDEDDGYETEETVIDDDDGDDE